MMDLVIKHIVFMIYLVYEQEWARSLFALLVESGQQMNRNPLYPQKSPFASSRKPCMRQ